MNTLEKVHFILLALLICMVCVLLFKIQRSVDAQKKALQQQHKMDSVLIDRVEQQKAYLDMHVNESAQ